MLGIVERLRWIIANRFSSAADFSRAAGLADNHVSTLITKLEADEGAVTLTTLISLARGAKVSLAWLITGRGPRDATENSDSQWRESRETAITILNKAVHDRVIAALRADHGPPCGYATFDYWNGVVRNYQARFDLDDQAERDKAALDKAAKESASARERLDGMENTLDNPVTQRQESPGATHAFPAAPDAKATKKHVPEAALKPRARRNDPG